MLVKLQLSDISGINFLIKINYVTDLLRYYILHDINTHHSPETLECVWWYTSLDYFRSHNLYIFKSIHEGINTVEWQSRPIKDPGGRVCFQGKRCYEGW